MNNCNHSCVSNCRREGCNCECGEFHVEIPKEFESLLVGFDLKGSYLCAWNADRRTDLEEKFINWCDENKVIDWE